MAKSFKDFLPFRICVRTDSLTLTLPARLLISCFRNSCACGRWQVLAVPSTDGTHTKGEVWLKRCFVVIFISEESDRCFFLIYVNCPSPLDPLFSDLAGSCRKFWVIKNPDSAFLTGCVAVHSRNLARRQQVLTRWYYVNHSECKMFWLVFASDTKTEKPRLLGALRWRIPLPPFRRFMSRAKAHYGMS